MIFSPGLASVPVRPPAHEDTHGIHYFAVDPGLGALKANVGRMVVAATGRTSGPIHVGWNAERKLFGHATGQTLPDAFGFDQHQVAVIRARTGYEAAEERVDIRLELLE